MKELLKDMIKSKRGIYLISTLVLILFALTINIAFSALINKTTKVSANITVNNMKYSMTLNGTPGTIIKIPANSTPATNVGITSLNVRDSKYELIYKVCSDSTCTSYINKPDTLLVEYSSKTVDSITGTIVSDGLKIIRIVATNTSDNDIYIQLDMNAGYSYNTLALLDLINSEFNEEDIIIAAYVGGEFTTTFPTTNDYNATVECTVNGNPTTAVGAAVWDGTKWKVDITDATTSRTFCNVYFDQQLVTNFAYTGNYQVWTALRAGKYKIELWGAQGSSWVGEIVNGTFSPAQVGGKSAYVSGDINLNAGEKLYVYVGQDPLFTTPESVGPLIFGGGGHGQNGVIWLGGGGATDVRYFDVASPATENLVQNNSLGLSNRIIVAAGGGGCSPQWNGNGRDGGHAGGLTGYNGTSGTGGTQTSGGFGISHTYTSYGTFYPGGGGGGYRSGTSGSGANAGATGGGGSSYISGHTGSVAIISAANQNPKAGCTTGTTDKNCSVHYSGKAFTNTVMIDGAGYSWTNVKGALTPMPNPSGGNYASGVGHSGHGYARITYLGD